MCATTSVFCVYIFGGIRDVAIVEQVGRREVRLAAASAVYLQ